MGDPPDSRRAAAKHRSAPRWLTLEIVQDAGDWSQFGPAGGLAVAAGEALARHERFKGTGPAQACIALSDDQSVRRLNRTYRGKDSATNVLSFPSRRPAGARLGPVTGLGDIVLAEGTIAREAAELGIAPAHHLQHLVIHGLLHLLGFDHGSQAEAKEMERLEVEILDGLGVASPYLAPRDGDRIATRPRALKRASVPSPKLAHTLRHSHSRASGS